MKLFPDQAPNNTPTQMQPTAVIPPGWKLNWNQLSNQVYQVRLASQMGLTVEMAGHDFDELVSQCVESVKEIEQQLARFT